MKAAASFAVVLVTAPNRRVARSLATAALHARLVACANLITGVESHYRWKGKMERAAETLILFKTTGRKVAALEKLMLETNPYDTPEFLVLKPSAGTERYLAWVGKSCAA